MQVFASERLSARGAATLGGSLAQAQKRPGQHSLPDAARAGDRRRILDERQPEGLMLPLFEVAGAARPRPSIALRPVRASPEVLRRRKLPFANAAAPVLHQRAHRMDHIGRLRDEGLLEREACRCRCIGTGEPQDRCPERAERVLGDARTDLGADAAHPACFMNHDGTACLSDRREDRLGVKRLQCSKVDDLRLNAEFGQLIRGGRADLH